MSCTDIRALIDRQLQLQEAGSEHDLERIRAHTRHCEGCAEYLDRAEQLERMLRGLPEVGPESDLCHQVMQQLTGQQPEQALSPQPYAEPTGPADSTEQMKQIELLLRSLPEIEPASDLCDRVMQRLSELPPEPAPEPELRRTFLSSLVPQLLRSLSYLLACAALVVGSRLELPASWLDRLALDPSRFELPALVPTSPGSMLLAVACLLLLLSIKTGPTSLLQRREERSRSS